MKMDTKNTYVKRSLNEEGGDEELRVYLTFQNYLNLKEIKDLNVDKALETLRNFNCIKDKNNPEDPMKIVVHGSVYRTICEDKDVDIKNLNKVLYHLRKLQYDQEELLKVNILYEVHVENDGWLPPVTNGEMAGTTGQAKRLEALKIGFLKAPSGLKIKYRAHVQDIGWQQWVSTGEIAGTIALAKSIEAIECKFEGKYAEEYKLEYRVHIQDIGWQQWVSNGEMAGTTGQAKQLEALEIRVIRSI